MSYSLGRSVSICLQFGYIFWCFCLLLRTQWCWQDLIASGVFSSFCFKLKIFQHFTFSHHYDSHRWGHHGHQTHDLHFLPLKIHSACVTLVSLDVLVLTGRFFRLSLFKEGLQTEDWRLMISPLFSHSCPQTTTWEPYEEETFSIISANWKKSKQRWG